jgi:hypothetical protein
MRAHACRLAAHMQGASAVARRYNQNYLWRHPHRLPLLDVPPIAATRRLFPKHSMFAVASAGPSPWPAPRALRPGVRTLVLRFGGPGPDSMWYEST